jgi:cytochrome c oxidase subunit IV
MQLEVQFAHAMTAVIGILFFVLALFDLFDWTKICQRFHFHPVAVLILSTGLILEPFTQAISEKIALPIASLLISLTHLYFIAIGILYNIKVRRDNSQ